MSISRENFDIISRYVDSIDPFRQLSPTSSSLPMLATVDTLDAMTTMPDAMKDFVDEQVAQKGYGSCSEYVRDLIRKEQDREKLRTLLLEGLQCGPGRVVDAASIFSDETR